MHNGVPYTDWVCNNGLCRNHMTECECNGCGYKAESTKLSLAKKKIKEHISYKHKDQIETTPLIEDDDLCLEEGGKCFIEGAVDQGVNNNFCLYSPNKRAKQNESELKFSTNESQIYYDQEKN